MRLGFVAIALLSLTTLVSGGCMSVEREPMVQIEPEYSYVESEPTLVLDDVYRVDEPVLTAADFDNVGP